MVNFPLFKKKLGKIKKKDGSRDAHGMLKHHSLSHRMKSVKFGEFVCYEINGRVKSLKCPLESV